MNKQVSNERKLLDERLSAIEVRGARTHNLKHVDLEIPHNKLTVLTGVSGSGKSSLAFDTIYSEGQRQYIEGLSTYARQFLNQLSRADVDSIRGLQPTLCIDQRVGVANPRSTVATITEIYDYLRVLMARVGNPACYECGAQISQQSRADILARIGKLPEGTRIVLMSPIVRSRKGAHREVFARIEKAGLLRVRVDGEMYEIEEVPDLAIRSDHTIEAVVDRIVLRDDEASRLETSVATALDLSSGLVSLSYQLRNNEEEPEPWKDELFNTNYSCASCGAAFEEIEPRTFSFNSPMGACMTCGGLGAQEDFADALLFQFAKGQKVEKGFTTPRDASAKITRKVRAMIRSACTAAGLDPQEVLEKAPGKKQTASMLSHLKQQLNELYDSLDEADKAELSSLRGRQDCDACGGSRLRPEALAVTLDGQSIYDITSLSIADAFTWAKQLKVPDSRADVAQPIVDALLHRLRFLNKVGVGYLTLARSADTLSGGELQRVRLATCIGNGLIGVTYILDEPSIGLHQRDNDRLIESMLELKKAGNTVLIVEHDEAMMRAADYLVDIGPGAGELGGKIVSEGTPKQVAKSGSLTADYLSGRKAVSDNSSRRAPTRGARLKLTGAKLHNLKNQTVEVPLGLLVGITGVSGSGKSSLISRTLLPALGYEIGQRQTRPIAYSKLSGHDKVDKLVEMTQAPIGRTPRSTPATYCGVFDLIRNVFASTKGAKARGFTAGRFSFNAGAGRCKTCAGQGQQRIEMNFLPDTFVHCPACNGRRFNRQTLRIQYKGLSISDVLELSVDEALEFFENFSKIAAVLQTLHDVGLGYLRLGQSSTTLSGGESQRIKLASELAKPSTGQTVYFLDEPTTGLHFDDIRRMIQVLQTLVEKGNTVVVIEHNLDVIRACDWLIDVGPDGGQHGGEVIACGPPEVIRDAPQSITGRYI